MDYRNYMPFGYGQMPYFEGFKFPIDTGEEEQMERDIQYMKSLYPSQAKTIQMLVDEECDKLEYDGSIMFDEYPDKLGLRKIGMDIFVKLNKDDKQEVKEEFNDDDMYMMNYDYRRRPPMPGPRPGPGPGPNNQVMDIIDILLFNEIYKRRCRHNRCRRRLYW